MAGSETSFNSYTFTYNWKINGLETRLHNPTKLNSPTFSSPSGARPATKWMLTVLNGECGTQISGLLGNSQQSLSVNLTHLACSPEPTPNVAGGGPIPGIGLQLAGRQVNSGGLQVNSTTGGLQLGQVIGNSGLQPGQVNSGGIGGLGRIQLGGLGGGLFS